MQIATTKTAYPADLVQLAATKSVFANHFLARFGLARGLSRRRRLAAVRRHGLILRRLKPRPRWNVAVGFALRPGRRGALLVAGIAEVVREARRVHAFFVVQHAHHVPLLAQYNKGISVTALVGMRDQHERQVGALDARELLVGRLAAGERFGARDAAAGEALGNGVLGHVA
jgi:hypothetical protein